MAYTDININSIVISGTKPLDIENYFKVNFGVLNDAINKLGDRSTELTVENKQLGLEIIEGWQKTVIEQLNTKEKEVKDFLDTFDLGTSSIYLSDEELDTLATHTGLILEYSTYADAWERNTELKRELEDITNKYKIVSESKSTEANVKELKGQYYTELYYCKSQLADADKECKKAATELIKALRKHPEVKAFIKKGGEFLSQVKDVKKAAVDKANKARINITIDNAAVRDALFDLVEFSL